jgi:ribonucleoside-triphosphate reductase
MGDSSMEKKEGYVYSTVSKIKNITKRDGRIVEFNPNKIRRAIEKAVSASDEYLSPVIVDTLVLSAIQEVEKTDETPTVEKLQDAIEFVLNEGGYHNIARTFRDYRLVRARERERNSELFHIFHDITYADATDSDIKRENANVDGNTAMGTMLKYGSEGAKHYYLSEIISPEFAEAHRKGYIHIHDMDFYPFTTTCCQIDLNKLFTGGFGTGHGAIREPQDIASYMALTCIAIQSNQNDQHGGQSIPSFDYMLAPGVKKTFKRLYYQNLKKALLSVAYEAKEDDIKQFVDLLSSTDYPSFSIDTIKEYQEIEYQALIAREIDKKVCVDVKKIQKQVFEFALAETERAVYQGCESVVHNLNTMHSRAGAQVPFSSINYGTDISSEGRMIIKNMLLATEAGLGEGETPIFPIQIFRLKDGINTKSGDPNYDLFKLACRVSAKRLFPNFSFQDAPYNLQYYKEGRPETEICYMGCRTRVIANRYDPENEISYSRGNLSFTSINLPKIALENKGNTDGFFKQLTQTMLLCKRQLLERLNLQMKKKVKNFPFLMGQKIWLGSEKLNPEDEVGDILKHGTLSIGFIGLAETLKVLVGKHHGESEKAQKLGLKIIKFMRETCDKYGEETGLNFTLLATPAEGLSGRFTRIDKKQFGIIEGVTDRDYYTNSFHVPVYYNITAFKKIQLEAPYHAFTNAGHISYVEVDGDIAHNLEAFENIVLAMKEAGIGYGAINHPVDRDPVCGYTGIINDVCPKCGREEGDIPFDRIRRITGYLVGTLDRFNNAKRKEESDRVKHM